MERKNIQGLAHQNLVLSISNGFRRPVPTAQDVKISGLQGPRSELNSRQGGPALRAALQRSSFFELKKKKKERKKKKTQKTHKKTQHTVNPLSGLRIQ